MEERKFSRRDFLRASAAAVTGTLVAACVPAKPEATPAEKPAEAEKPVTLEYWSCWSGIYHEKQRKHVLDPFEEEHPNIKIHDLAVASNIRQKMLTAVASGESPDAAACFGSLVSLAAAGACKPIDEYVNASDTIELDACYEPRLKACKWRGKLWGFPYNCSAEILLCNETLFEEAGLDPEKCLETWEEFTAASKKLVKFDEEGNLVQAAYVTWIPRHPSLWFWCNGGEAYNVETDELTIDDPKNIEGLQQVIDYAWDVYGDPAKADAFVEGAGSAAESPFCVGAQAMAYSGDWMPSVYWEWCPDTVEKALKPCLWPKGPQGEEQVASGAGDFITVLKGAPHPDEAYTFIEWMLMHGNLKWTKAGIDTNCLKRDAGVVREEWPHVFGDKAGEIAEWWAKTAELSHPVETFPAYEFMVDELSRVFDLAIHKKMTAKEALTEAQANVEEERQKYVVPE